MMAIPNNPFQSRNTFGRYRNKLMVAFAIILMCMMWTANVSSKNTDVLSIKTRTAVNTATNREQDTQAKKGDYADKSKGPSKFMVQEEREVTRTETATHRTRTADDEMYYQIHLEEIRERKEENEAREAAKNSQEKSSMDEE